MEKQVYQEIELKDIVHNSLNPRKNFFGSKFDELIISIQKKGVLEPILVRPKNGGGFEIVVGERRFRALCEITKKNSGLDEQTIPAIIQELNDDDVFDIILIENLCREDLTELEEAEIFKSYLESRGEGSLKHLAERTGIHERYMRRRIAVLKLPKQVLMDWENGELLYGHLEELCRLDNEKEIFEFTNKIKKYRGAVTVKMLKKGIDSRSINFIMNKDNQKQNIKTESFLNIDYQKRYQIENKTRIFLQKKLEKRNNQINKLKANIDKLAKENANLKTLINELIHISLKKGIDLTGMVPEEILNK